MPALVREPTSRACRGCQFSPDFVTDTTPGHVAAVAVSHSHGGAYVAGVASHEGLRSVIFDDAGAGIDLARVAGGPGLDPVGVAAAADRLRGRVGSVGNTLASCRMTVANADTVAVWTLLYGLRRDNWLRTRLDPVRLPPPS